MDANREPRVLSDRSRLRALSSWIIVLSGVIVVTIGLVRQGPTFLNLVSIGVGLAASVTWVTVLRRRRRAAGVKRTSTDANG